MLLQVALPQKLGPTKVSTCLPSKRMPIPNAYWAPRATPMTDNEPGLQLE